MTFSASAGNSFDVTVSPNSLTFSASNYATAQTITVSAIDDTQVEGTETARIRHNVTGSVYTGINVPSARVIVTDNDLYGVILCEKNVVVKEGMTETQGVRLGATPTADITVAFTMTGSGFTVSPSSMTFTSSNWGTGQTLSIAGSDDLDPDDETGTVTIAVTSTDANFNNVRAGPINVNVSDDETARVLLSTNVAVVEGAAAVTVPVTLSTAPKNSVTVNFAKSTDAFTISPTSLTFTTSNWGTAQNLAVTASDDGNAISETGVITVTTTSTGANSGDYNDIDVPNISVSVTDNDHPGLRLSEHSLDVTEDAADADASYCAKLTSQPTATVTVTLTAENSLVTLTPSSWQFTTADWNTCMTTIVRPTTDDDVVNGPRVDTIRHAISGGDYDTLPDVTARVDLYDDEAAVVHSMNAVTIAEGASQNITVSLNSAPPGGVARVTIGSDNPDVRVSPAFWVATTDNYQTGVTVQVSSTEDPDAVAKTAIITSSAARFQSATLMVTVTDNDTAGIVISQTAVSSTEGGAAGSYTVRLTSRPTADVTITATSANMAEVTVSPSVLSFDRANWNRQYTVTVTAVDDRIDEQNSMVTITHTVASADTTYAGFMIDSVTATVTDNDTAGLTLSQNISNINEGASTFYFVRLNTEPTGDVNVINRGAAGVVALEPSRTP